MYKNTIISSTSKLALKVSHSFLSQSALTWEFRVFKVRTSSLALVLKLGTMGST
jgi:hypothetical protein